MDYYWYHDHTDIYMPAEHQDAALARFKELLANASWRNKRPGWVEEVLKTETLADAIEFWGWKPTFSKSGNLLDIEPWAGSGEEFKNEHEVVLFQALALGDKGREGDPDTEYPFYIELHDSENNIWRWVFKNGRVLEVNAEMTFPLEGAEEAKDE